MKLNSLSVLIISNLLGLALAQTGAAPKDNYIGSTPAQRHIINSTQASAVISAAEAEASSAGLPSNIAVTDSSGLLVAFLKTDNAFVVSTEISIKKARTVTLFNGAYTTAGLYNVSQPGNSLYGMLATPRYLCQHLLTLHAAIEETNGGLIVFGGGLPIFVDG